MIYYMGISKWYKSWNTSYSFWSMEFQGNLKIIFSKYLLHQFSLTMSISDIGPILRTCMFTSIRVWPPVKCFFEQIIKFLGVNLEIRKTIVSPQLSEGFWVSKNHFHHHYNHHHKSSKSPSQFSSSSDTKREASYHQSQAAGSCRTPVTG